MVEVVGIISQTLEVMVAVVVVTEQIHHIVLEQLLQVEDIQVEQVFIQGQYLYTVEEVVVLVVRGVIIMYLKFLILLPIMVQQVMVFSVV